MQRSASSIANAMQGGVPRQQNLERAQAVRPEIAHSFSFTGTATAVQYDQIPFYSVLADVAKSASHILGTATPIETRWSAAALWQFGAFNPAPLVNVQIAAFNNTANLAGGKVEKERITPDGGGQIDVFNFIRYRSASDYQLDTMQAPIGGEALDGYTVIRLIFAGHATPNTFRANFLFGPSLDRRAGVPAAAARAVLPFGR